MAELDVPETVIARPRALQKNWRSYLFEFVLLFLAVTLGFFVDNSREYFNERNQERAYMQQMVQDIDDDLALSKSRLASWKAMDLRLDTLLFEMSSNHIATNSNKAHRLWSSLLGYPSFVRNDRTIAQLKSHGLHLIQTQPVSDAIMKYDALIRNVYSQQAFMDNAMLNSDYFTKVFSFIKLDANPAIPVPLSTEGVNALDQAYGRQKLWRIGMRALMKRMEAAQQQGVETKQLILTHYPSK